jgi:hypothetical protein
MEKIDELGELQRYYSIFNRGLCKEKEYFAIKRFASAKIGCDITIN